MEGGRPLVFVSDEELLDDVLRLAAAADCDVERVADPTAARPRWGRAPIVLLDATTARQCITAGLPRRDGILVISLGEPPATAWPDAVELGASRVLSLPESESVLAGELADAVELPSGAGRVLAVVGARGGAGASVFAAALAITALRRDERALLVDCDSLGGGLDLVLGAEDRVGLRWPDLSLTSGRVSASSLRAALPSPRSCNGLTLLSCDRSGAGPEPDAVTAVLDAGRRSGETVICDLPRYLTDAAVAALDVADLSVLVVPAEVRACAAAARVAATISARGTTLRAVVRGPSPGGIGPDDVSRALGIALAAKMPPEPGLDRALDRGQQAVHPRGPLAKAAEAVLDLAVREGALVGAR